MRLCQLARSGIFVVFAVVLPLRCQPVVVLDLCNQFSALRLKLASPLLLTPEQAAFRRCPTAHIFSSPRRCSRCAAARLPLLRDDHLPIAGEKNVGRETSAHRQLGDQHAVWNVPRQHAHRCLPPLPFPSQPPPRGCVHALRAQGAVAFHPHSTPAKALSPALQVPPVCLHPELPPSAVC